MKWIICYIFFIPIYLSGQNLSNSLGDFQSLKKIPGGIEIKVSNGYCNLQFYEKNIVRIRINRQNFEPDISYAVIDKPDENDLSIIEQENILNILATEFTIKIQKKPLRISFLTKENQIINEDESAFGVNWVGQEVTCYKKLQEGERFIGLGEKTGMLDRRGNAFVNWNSDHPAYEIDDDPLYQSIPFYIGLHHQLAYGIFFDNSFKTSFSFGASNDRFSSFSAEDGEMNYYFIYAKTVPEIIEGYTKITGRMEMPPIWSLGYQQSRWSYYPESKVRQIALTFREKRLPCDVIWLDIQYMDEFKLFTWDKKLFPNPPQLIADLKKQGFKVVTIIDPGIKAEKGYLPCDEGLKNNYFVKYPDGTPYKGQVWPGWCYFPDFTNPKTRDWWGNLFKTNVDMGIGGFWTDMNEPSTWGQYVPNLIEFDWEGARATHKKAHNIYGLEMARSTYEGTKKLLKGERTFNLTRAGYSGIQRYSAVWTGDNVSSNDHMITGIRILNSMSLSGIPFVGMDVGGFMGEPTPDLYARWFSIGAFTPFFRTHSAINKKDQEPWAFGEEVENICRKYLSIRYRLIPYLYSLFYEASTTGHPIMRALSYYHPFNNEYYNWDFQNEYYYGSSFLVAPVSSKMIYSKVWLPPGSWYRYGNDSIYNGNQTVLVDSPLNDLPVFVKSGSIIPEQSIIQSTSEAPSDTLEIHVYNGQSGTFQYYEDDGITYQYQNNDFYMRTFNFDYENHTLTCEPVLGNRKSKFNFCKIIFHDKNKKIVTVSNTNLQLKVNL